MRQDPASMILDELRANAWWYLGGVALLLVVAYLVRPVFHSFLIAFYANPHLLQGILFAGAAWLAGRYYHGRGVANSAAVLVGVVFFLAAGFFAAPLTGVAMADRLDEQATSIDRLPDVDTDAPRLLPRRVADQYAQNSLQEPRYRLGESDLAVRDDGRPVWSYPLRPDGGLNTLLLEQGGAAFTDMTTTNAETSRDDTGMPVGVGLQVTDNIEWQLAKHEYWADYQDHVMIPHEDSLYIATPYVSYDWTFRFPFILGVPEWGGVALTDDTGSTEYVEPGEVASHPVLEDQRSYPFALARAYVSSMKYRNGIVNAWFFHEDQLEVAPVPGLGNDQPFTILTDSGPSLFIATEPYGDASGLFEIWTVDASTGDYSVYRLNRTGGLIGANKAVNFVRQANSKVNWASRGDSNGFRPIEPLPVVVDDTLYWQVHAVPVDGAGVAFTSFVNAKTTDVYTAETDRAIKAYLRGDQNASQNTTDVGQSGPAGEQTSIVVRSDGGVAGSVTVNGTNYTIDVTRRDS